MEHIKDLLTFLGIIVLPYLGYIHRRINQMSKSLNNRVTTVQMEKYVDLRQQPNNVKLDSLDEKVEDVKEYLDKCNDKLDGIKDLLLNQTHK